MFCIFFFFSLNGIVSAKCDNARDCLEVQYKVNNVFFLTKKPKMRSNTVKVKVLCQHQFRRMKCMYACTGAWGSPLSPQGHTLCTPGSVIMHCKQLWWEKARCDRLDSDWQWGLAWKRGLFSLMWCVQGYFLDQCTHDILTRVNGVFLFMQSRKQLRRWRAAQRRPK